jgi:peptide/nickel transport system permease protein
MNDQNVAAGVARSPLASWLLPLASGVSVRLLTIIVAAALIFLGTTAIPGDFVSQLLGQDYTPELASRIRSDLGLDRNLVERFALWLGGFLRGEFGVSFTTRTPVWDVVEPRLINTMLLAATVLPWFPVAMAFGVWAFLAKSLGRGIFRIAAQVVMCTPEFLLAYILVYVFAVELRLLPAISKVSADAPLWEQFRALLLPSTCLGLGMVAYVGQMVQSLLDGEQAKDYFEFARLKGLSRWQVVRRLAIPAVAPTILNLFLAYCAYLLTGVLVVEVVFGYPGIGELAVSSVVWRDVPVLQFCAVAITTIYITLYSLSDIVSAMSRDRMAM